MELTKEQKKAQDAIMDWVMKPTRYIALSGYAGTGKTTVLGNTVNRILNETNLTLRMLTYTGKASYVFSEKMREFNVPLPSMRAQCSTIHSYLYTFVGVDKEYKPQFVEKDEGCREGDILIIDEASMVDPKIFQDLFSLNIPIIFVGDPGQLPPINEGVFQPLLDTELFLSTPLRQALDNPIIQIATDIREGNKVRYGFFDGKAAKLSQKRALPFLTEFQKTVGNEDTVILCGLNATRVTHNKKVRFIRGFEQPKPMSGERLVCLQNTREKDLMNGQCVLVEKCEVLDEDLGYYMIIRPEGSDVKLEAIAYANAFHCKTGGELSKRYYEEKRDIDAFMFDYSHISPLMFFDYGYCMSVHKSQGSEWSKVALRAQRLNADQSEEDYIRWLYTGVTRAKDKLLIITD